jgi:hypothetical protein
VGWLGIVIAVATTSVSSLIRRAANTPRRLEDLIRQRRGEIKAHLLPAGDKAVELDEE